MLLIVILLNIRVVITFEVGRGRAYLIAKYLFLTVYTIPEKKKKKKNRNLIRQAQKIAAKTAQVNPPTKVRPVVSNDEPKAQSAETTASMQSDAESGTHAADEQAATTQSATVDEEKNKAENGTNATKEVKKRKEKKIDYDEPTLGETLHTLKLLANAVLNPRRKPLKQVKFYNIKVLALCGGEDAAKAAMTFGTINFAVSNILGLISSYFTLKQPRIDIRVNFEKPHTAFYCFGNIRLSLFTVIVILFRAAMIEVESESQEHK